MGTYGVICRSGLWVLFRGFRGCDGDYRVYRAMGFMGLIIELEFSHFGPMNATKNT